MEIRGEINVGRSMVAGWAAEQLTLTPSPTGQYTYWWRMNADHGPLTGTLQHKPSDGPVLLASLVLAAYVERTQCNLCEWYERQDLCSPTFTNYALLNACEFHREREAE